jgi:hypothetical protein
MLQVTKETQTELWSGSAQPPPAIKQKPSPHEPQEFVHPLEQAGTVLLVGVVVDVVVVVVVVGAPPQ